MTSLSVVVAGRAAELTEAATAIAALADELSAGDQLVWVDRDGLSPSPALARATVVAAPGGASRGDCYGVGLAAAAHRLVAFTDSSTAVAPGWRDAAVAALEAGATVVGGPVLPARPRLRPDWAGFLVDYAPHAVPPYLSATGDLAGNNVAYRREALPGAGPVWKNQVNAALRAQGVEPTVAAGMRVTVGRRYSPADLGLPRLRSGALYAAQRSRGWPPARRAVAAGGCGVLPALIVWRLWSTVRQDAVLRSALLSSLPWVAVAAMTWSVGEAVGYAVRTEAVSGVW